MQSPGLAKKLSNTQPLTHTVALPQTQQRRGCLQMQQFYHYEIVAHNRYSGKQWTKGVTTDTKQTAEDKMRILLKAGATDVYLRRIETGDILSEMHAEETGEPVLACPGVVVL